MLEVVELQRVLIEALCSVSDQSRIGLAWLLDLWPQCSPSWVNDFWENDSGNRSKWCREVASATLDEKQTILALINVELRFDELYTQPPNVRISPKVWKEGIFKSAKKLLLAFYTPMFYERKGFQSSSGDWFHKDIFIDPRPTICPYTDNFIQDVKLDHFLPKDQFPMLSCHPDNLIPCGTDPNSGSHKGTKIPLSPNELDQAESWFHPRWRSAEGKFGISFQSTPGSSQPEVRFVANSPDDQIRLDNLESIFGLSEFWGRILDDEVQNVASDVQGLLEYDSAIPNEENVRSRVLARARQERARIGRDGLAIVKSFFYEHIANTPSLLAQVVRECN